jgi:hypothetical protein
MIKRDFCVWDFIENKPKRHSGYIDLDNNRFIGMEDTLLHWNTNYVTNVSDAFNNTTLSTISTNLTVNGTITSEPREGDMRTIMDVDGYWSTQFYTEAMDGPMWVTTSRIQSMITLGDTLDFTKKSVWSKIKSWFKKNKA